MKKISVLSLTMLFILGISFNSLAQKKGEAEVKFKTSIECNSCKEKITKNIPYEKGVTDLEVNVENKEVTVKYKIGKTDAKKIAAAINKLDITTEVISDSGASAGCCPSSKEKKECGSGNSSDKNGIYYKIFRTRN